MVDCAFKQGSRSFISWRRAKPMFGWMFSDFMASWSNQSHHTCVDLWDATEYGNKHRSPGGLKSVRRAYNFEGGLPLLSIDLSMVLICAPSAHTHFMYFQVETNGRQFNEAHEWLITQVWLYSRVKNVTFDAIHFSFWEARSCHTSDLSILASEISTCCYICFCLPLPVSA